MSTAEGLPALAYDSATLFYSIVDRAYLYLDKRLVRRTRNLELVPDISRRRGGKVSYGEWCHVIGIFQTLLYLHLKQKEDNHILDVGCGTGILAIASEPFLGDVGSYTGIDVMIEDVKFCQRHYPKDHFSFQHLDTQNLAYAPQQDSYKRNWSVADASVDAVTALSVWTHLDEETAIFYFREIDRVLRPGGIAIVTFFLLDDMYHRGVEARTDARGRYHRTRQRKWVFDQPCSESNYWFCPIWAKVPEQAIGIVPDGLDMLLRRTSLRLDAVYPGNWKEMPGLFFQDILVFGK